MACTRVASSVSEWRRTKFQGTTHGLWHFSRHDTHLCGQPIVDVDVSIRLSE
eukprot:m.202575 g.202575  ORF g.202575 m.202575 type:complete len:52 (-) comp15365_c2_seq1:5155-5310(-)